jgi:hypothetical protein
MERAMTESSKPGEQAKPRVGTTQGTEQDGAPPAKTTPWAFFVVITAFVCVTIVFLVVWLFPTPKVFTQSSEVIAVLSTTFGVIGTLVGTYFGIKTTGDARDTVERVQTNAAKAIAGSSTTGGSKNRG